MIRNEPELQEATQSEVVVGEVGTTAFEMLATTLFAIHVVMCHTPFRDSGNEASIRVPRMLHSHV
jgi:hypothetical protein